MPLGREIGLGPGHVVSDNDLAPPKKGGTARQFAAHVCCGQTAGWINMLLDTEVGLGPGNIVLDGDPARPLEKGGTTASTLWPMSIVAKRSPISATAELLFSPRHVDRREVC